MYKLQTGYMSENEFSECRDWCNENKITIKHIAIGFNRHIAILHINDSKLETFARLKWDANKTKDNK